MLPPDGLLPTTETVNQAASAAYDSRFRRADFLPDPEIDPNQVLRDPNIQLDRVNPPEAGTQIDPVIQRHVVDENDPESRRRALTDDRPDLTLAAITNYRYMYDDENQLEKSAGNYQFATMVNHTVRWAMMKRLTGSALTLSFGQRSFTSFKLLHTQKKMKRSLKKMTMMWTRGTTRRMIHQEMAQMGPTEVDEADLEHYRNVCPRYQPGSTTVMP